MSGRNRPRLREGGQEEGALPQPRPTRGPFGDQGPDSAAAYYSQVAGQFPRAGRAPTALYRLGRLAEAGGNRAAARTYYERILKDYPRSDDAALAQDRLTNLRP